MRTRNTYFTQKVIMLTSESIVTKGVNKHPYHSLTHTVQHICGQ